MKVFSRPSTDVIGHIERMQSEHHPDLDQVTVDALFTFDEEHSGPVLKHQGYAAAAVVSITPVKQRALGVADAIIVVDRATWLDLSALQRDALMDHELYHLHWKVDDEGKPLSDGLGRPKLAMRKHDWKIEGFDEIVQRHGLNALEALAAKHVLTRERQLLFQFGTTNLQDAVDRAVQENLAPLGIKPEPYPRGGVTQ